MRFTDVFIRRPVLTFVVSAIILLAGLLAVRGMQVRQYPQISNAVITVTTVYTGADARLVQGFITAPIQAAMAKVGGVDYVTSNSRDGVSVVTAYVRQGTDSDTAMTDAVAQVSSAQSELPSEAQQPVVSKTAGGAVSALYVAFFSDTLQTAQINDYVDRVVRPQLLTLDGVAKATVMGAPDFAVRVWLDPLQMAQRNISPSDVVSALRANNRLSAAGSVRSAYDARVIRLESAVTDVAAFENLVVKTTSSGVVRLGDLAVVTFGADSNDAAALSGGRAVLTMEVGAAPGFNVLTMVNNVRAALPNIKDNLPAGITMKVVYDASASIHSAVDKVRDTAIEAVVIVLCVVLLFMGSVRSTIIPIVAMPLSLVGACVFMVALGFSLNLLTFLAFVLAVGLVVDDAIVVVENVHRHIKEGLPPFQAAIVGAREVAVPVISMTITLAAVYAPVAVIGGLTGTLFKEFALTLSAAVIVSGVVALTLSPMMCSMVFKGASSSRFQRIVDNVFHGISVVYERNLRAALYRPVPTLIVAFVTLLALPIMFYYVPKELAPKEDQGIVLSLVSGPAQASPEYMLAYGGTVAEIFGSVPEKEDDFLMLGIDGIYNGFAGLALKPWDQRERSDQQVAQGLQNKLNSIPGLNVSVFSLPPLPGPGGLPVQFVVKTPGSYESLAPIVSELAARARKSGLFLFQTVDLKFERPEIIVAVDREAAGKYGVSMQAISDSLAIVFGEGYVNRTDFSGRGYKVIPQVARNRRLQASNIGGVYVPNDRGRLTPLSALIDVRVESQPNTLQQFNQLNAATFSAVPMPGVSMEAALTFLEKTARELLPVGVTYDFSGEARQYKTEGSSLTAMFAISVLVIYLVLAAQYESFRDPLVIMVSVPLAMLGALALMAMGLTTLNIYTQMGMITLVGLISKHGILICEVARSEQINNGKSRIEAVAHAAVLRLRPILMTTAAMVAGALPLTMSSGSAANSQFSIGLILCAGLTVGSLFTLFVLPVIYRFIGENHLIKQHAKQKREAGIDFGGTATPR